MTEPDESPDESKSKATITRRDAIATLAAAGALGATASAVSSSSTTDDSVGVGGGPMSDEMSHLNIRWYQGSEADLPEPGVEGRYFKVTSGGTLWNTGDVLEDTGSSWERVDLGVENFEAGSASIEEADIGRHEADENRSITGPLNDYYLGSARADDGTFYGLTIDGADWRLDSTTTPQDPDSWSEIYRFSGTYDSGVELVTVHVTSGGSILCGFNGAIRRSTDGGASFSTVYDLSASDSAIWSFAENSSGDIVAGERPCLNNNPRLYKSTDDGASWTLLADGSTFTEFAKHIHKVKYHPVNDYLIVTGGDGGGQGFYRSTDNGSTWTWHVTKRQCVAIGCHPTDGNRYFVVSDAAGMDTGVYRISDDGSTITSELVQGLNMESRESAAAGSFIWDTVTGSDGSYYVAGTINESENRLLVSTDLSGENWRAVDLVEPYGTTGFSFSDLTSMQGPYGSQIDADTVETLVTGSRYLRTKTAASPMWGSALPNPIDKRETARNINFGDNQHLLRDRIEPSEYPIAYLWDIIDQSDGSNPFTVYYENGWLRLDNGNNITFEHRVSSGTTNFYDDTGTQIAQMDGNGNLNLAGSVTENATF